MTFSLQNTHSHPAHEWTGEETTRDLGRGFIQERLNSSTFSHAPFWSDTRLLEVREVKFRAMLLVEMAKPYSGLEQVQMHLPIFTIAQLVMRYLHGDDQGKESGTLTAFEKMFFSQSMRKSISQSIRQSTCTVLLSFDRLLKTHHKWVLDYTEVTVQLNGAKLVCKVVNHKTGKMKRPFYIEGPGETLLEKMANLSQRFAKIGPDGKPNFFLADNQGTYGTLIHGTWGKESEYRLLEHDKKLFWQVFDRTINMTSQFECDDFLFTDMHNCSEITLAKLLQLRNRRWPISETVIFLKSFEVREVTYAPITKPEIFQESIQAKLNLCPGQEDRPSRVQQLQNHMKGLLPARQVWFAPISHPSTIDNRYVVSEFLWAVTLVCYGGYRNNHAIIVIEGMEIGTFFMQIAHLRWDRTINADAIEFRSIPPDTLRYVERTEIWKVPSTKVKEMFNSIEIDERSPPKLNICGRDSVLAKHGEESCFTWAREKLKICGIDLGKSLFGFAITRTKNYTITEQSHKQNNNLSPLYNKI